MVVKVYISGISGNKEVKKRQQRVLMILDSKNISYEVVDITEPGKEAEKDFMQTNSTSPGATVSDTNPRHALPPQLFNDADYCGDYDLFDLANELDTLEQFLKVELPPAQPEKLPLKEESPSERDATQQLARNGVGSSRESSPASQEQGAQEMPSQNALNGDANIQDSSPSEDLILSEQAASD